MLEQHSLTRSSRLARHVKRVESCRDVTSQVEFGPKPLWCSGLVE